MSKFSNRPHQNHVPHMYEAALILLAVFVASVALAIGSYLVCRALIG